MCKRNQKICKEGSFIARNSPDSTILSPKMAYVRYAQLVQKDKAHVLTARQKPISSLVITSSFWRFELFENLNDVFTIAQGGGDLAFWNAPGTERGKSYFLERAWNGTRGSCVLERARNGTRRIWRSERAKNGTRKSERSAFQGA